MSKHLILLLTCTLILCCAQSCTSTESGPAGDSGLPVAATGGSGNAGGSNDIAPPPPATSKCAAPSLRAELLAMVEKDQAVRRELIAAGADRPDRALLQKVTAIDEANTARVKEIVNEHGWPGAAKVGSDGCHAAFLIIQHADLATQEEMLPLVETAFLVGDLSGESLALLQDRVLMKKGEPQIYGTQILSFDKWKDGRPAVHPIADEEHVDERRVEMGMPPLKEYLEFVKRVYFPQKAAKETEKEH